MIIGQGRKAEHLEFTAEINTCTYSSKSENLKGRDLFEDGGINGRIILKYILKE
jgi:hypothetical protein